MNVISKTQATADYLRERIEQSFYPDGKLPRELDLAAELKVGRITVRRALQTLEQENLIERKKRAGTFIRPSSVKNRNQMVGLLMRVHGHMFADFHHYIIEKLTDRGLSANVLSDSGPRFSSPRPSLVRAATRLAGEKLRGLLIDAYMAMQLPNPGDFLAKAPVFFDYYNFMSKLDITGVWFDYEKAGYLGGKYLLENGCRHPLLICHPLPMPVRLNPAIFSRHREKLIMDGFSRALKEYGMNAADYILDPIYADLERLEEIIVPMFCNSSLRPDGILGSGDWLLLKPLKLAMSMGLKIHRELRVVGINNTPWSNEISLQPFSSVDLQLEVCAEKLVEQVCLHPQDRENVYIEPKLIIRN